MISYLGAADEIVRRSAPIGHTRGLAWPLLCAPLTSQPDLVAASQIDSRKNNNKRGKKIK